MPKPKGCRCPYKCPVHPDRVPTVAEGEKVTTSPNTKPSSATPLAPESPASVVNGKSVADIVRDAAEKAESGEPRPADPGPQKGRTPKGKKKQGPTTAQLADTLAELLVLPAIPAKMVLGCEFCRDHFLEEGPKAAAEIAAMSEGSEPLRKFLERIHEGLTMLTWGSVLTAYIGKPLLHHAAPEPILEGVGPVMGVPTTRPERPDLSGLFGMPHTHGTNGTPTPPPHGTNGTHPQGSGSAGSAA